MMIRRETSSNDVGVRNLHKIMLNNYQNKMVVHKKRLKMTKEAIAARKRYRQIHGKKKKKKKKTTKKRYAKGALPVGPKARRSKGPKRYSPVREPKVYTSGPVCAWKPGKSSGG